MMLTPVMFLFFFLWAPSGLVIYWTGEQPARHRPAVCDEPDHRARRS